MTPKPGTIVFAYPEDAPDPDKPYPAIVCDVHEGDPPLVDLVMFNAEGGLPVADRPGYPFLSKKDDNTVRPFALAHPYPVKKLKQAA